MGKVERKPANFSLAMLNKLDISGGLGYFRALFVELSAPTLRFGVLEALCVGAQGASHL